ALVSGDLQAADLPAAWNDKYRCYLGITPPNDSDGVLQDVHWSAGLVGYFPTYSLGNISASQFFDQPNPDLADLNQQIVAGNFAPLREWLRDKIHRHGQCYTATELVERVTGQPLSHGALMQHLHNKFDPLYAL